MTSYYRDDLTYIHDSGFVQLAENAALVLREELKRSGLEKDCVVDLGCGGGVLSKALQQSGYGVLGIDQSEPSIALARRRVPEATFRVASYVTESLPPCVGVAAIGEVFNYTFDEASSAETLAAVVGRIHSALAPGGVLLFDMAGPDRLPTDGPRRHFVEGPDWTVLAETEGNESRTMLTRKIVSFRKQGELYRRDAEVHRLWLADPSQVAELLRATGFEVQVLAKYASLALPPGLTAFLATKRGA